MRNKLLLFALALLSATSLLQAQWFRDPMSHPFYHNFTAGLRGGPCFLMDDNNANTSARMGYSFGFDLGYTYLSSPSFGWHTGISVSHHRAVCRYGGSEREVSGLLSFFDEGFHGQARQSQFLVRTDPMDETYTATYLEIPIELFFPSRHFYLMGGLKLMLPLAASSHFDGCTGSVGVGYVITGTSTRVSEPIEVSRFDANGVDCDYAPLSKDRICFPLYIAGTLEMGYRIGLSRNHQLMIAAYGDISINTSSFDGDSYVINLEGSGDNFRFDGTVGAHETPVLRYLSAGIRLTYSFGNGPRVGSYTHRVPFRISNSINRFVW